MKKIANESAIKKMIMPFVNQPTIQKKLKPFLYATQLHGNDIMETENGNLTCRFYNVLGFNNDGRAVMYAYINPETLEYKVYQHKDVYDGKSPLIEVKCTNDFEKTKLSAMVGVTLWNAFYGCCKNLYPIQDKSFQLRAYGEVEKDFVDL